MVTARRRTNPPSRQEKKNKTLPCRPATKRVWQMVQKGPKSWMLDRKVCCLTDKFAASPKCLMPISLLTDKFAASPKCLMRD